MKIFILAKLITFAALAFGLDMKLTNVGDKVTPESLFKTKKMLKTNAINENSILLLGLDNDDCGGSGTSLAAFEVKSAFRYLNYKLNKGDKVDFCGSNLKAIEIGSGQRMSINGLSCKDRIEFRFGKLCQCVIEKATSFRKFNLKVDDKLFFDGENIYSYIPATSYFDQKSKYKFEKGNEYSIKNEKIIKNEVDVDHQYSCYPDI